MLSVRNEGMHTLKFLINDLHMDLSEFTPSWICTLSTSGMAEYIYSLDDRRAPTMKRDPEYLRQIILSRSPHEIMNTKFLRRKHIISRRMLEDYLRIHCPKRRYDLHDLIALGVIYRMTKRCRLNGPVMDLPPRGS